MNAPRPTIEQIKSQQQRIDALDTAAPESDAATLESARLCVGVGRLRDAADRFDHLLTSYPDHPGLWLEAGRLADALGESDLAVERLSIAAQSSGPIGIEALRDLTHAAFHAENVQVAGRACFRLSRRCPEDPMGWAGLIVVAQLARRPKLLLAARLAMARRFDRTTRAGSLAAMWIHAAACDVQEPITIPVILNDPGNAAATSDPSTGSSPKPSADQDETTRPSPAEFPTPDAFKDLVAFAEQTFVHHTIEHADRADAHFHLAACRAASGRLQSAHTSVDQALTINPNYLRAQKLRSEIDLHTPIQSAEELARRWAA